VLVVERLEPHGRRPTRLVSCVGGKRDLNVLGAGRLVDRVYHWPFQVLVDKDGTAASLRVTPSTWLPPNAFQFDESVNRACAAALECAKAVVTGDAHGVAPGPTHR
jgi:hypothetical protein